jgi:hypothetical protein
LQHASAITSAYPTRTPLPTLEKVLTDRIVDADPAERPLDYQRELLSFLGERDLVDVLADTPDQIQVLITGLTDEQLHQRPAGNEWSIAEQIGHLWDDEILYGFRARAILAEDEPLLIGTNQDRWNALPKPPLPELLIAYRALRAAHLALLRGIPEADWEREGIHQERGRTSFRLLWGTVAGHDLAHLQQLRETRAQIREGD